MARGGAAEIRLMPSGLAVVGPNGLRFEEPLESSSWSRLWETGLSELDEPLKRLLAKVPVCRKSPLMVYHAPESAVEVMTLPVSPRDAVRAARLRLSESCMITDSFVSACVLSSQPGSCTALAVGDSAERVNAIAAWLERCGVRDPQIIPGHAKAIADVSQFALLAPRPGVFVWVDRHFSAVVGGSSGRIRFARTLSTGYDVLSEAYGRATRSSDPSIAVKLLTECGIPKRGTVLSEDPPLKAEDVLHLLQPALQRLAIEVKQTVRFAATEQDMSSPQLSVAGPGSLIKGLTEALGFQLDTSVKLAVGDAAAIDPALLSLESMIGTQQRSRRQFAWAVRFGVAAAAALVALDHSLASRELRNLTAQADELRPLVESARSGRRLEELTLTSESELAKIDLVLGESVGRRAPWAAVLRSLSRHPIPGLKLHEMGIVGNGDNPKLAARGSIAKGADSDAGVGRFVAWLRETGLYSDVVLQSNRVDDEQRTTFAVSMEPFTFNPDQLASGEKP